MTVSVASTTMAQDLYCSEQICIPPSFPYLLRQYAKAAIRTQPSDLLKWSTAYFRCLSLNVPPPIKPRLEYPIPRDFNGITPGWLKTLLYQLQNNLSIPFKILWDRWIGACLQHHTLIQLLCLGGFEDPQAIPWLKFIAVCAGTLTDVSSLLHCKTSPIPKPKTLWFLQDLTHTMILICEILTEEPEGGSAMIQLETFLELYTFLARIDASCDQTVRNFAFRDSLLSLWKEKAEKEDAKEVEQQESVVELDESILTKTSTESMEEGEKLEEVDKVVSCPSLPEDDHYSIEYLLKQNEDPEEYLEQDETPEEPTQEEPEQGTEEQESKKEQGSQEALEPDQVEEKEEPQPEPEPEPVAVASDSAEEVKEYESVNTLTEQPVRDLDAVFEDDATLQEDLQRLKALQQELAGETDEELEKFKCRLIEEMPLTESQQQGVKHFQLGGSGPVGEVQLISVEEEAKSLISGGGDVEQDQDVKPYEDVHVEALPGIGPMVPEHLINAVVAYMRGCAKNQHGMVMPRNIRHYSCPPLEATDS
ncbi:uncharacterized protein LOC109538734 isoform X1 [Dendroctonus ponderosae]|uniref:uncharacterized protein LOC109538734 isoform X1 n=1 Tax=Dendroctonus ponderosae TaxID=77166 RepID=UPI002034F1FD|nr:uncharacterized protein LOC109538734 isoform X1 [Dendroctonus ponderosae]